MATGFSYQGATGQLYNFVLIDTASPKTLPWQGGLVILARYTPTPLYVGVVDSFHGFFSDGRVWETAQNHHDAAVALILIEPDEEKQAQIGFDLIEKHAPPMNAEMDSE